MIHNIQAIYLARAKQQGARFARNNWRPDGIRWSDIAKAIGYVPQLNDELELLIEDKFMDAFYQTHNDIRAQRILDAPLSKGTP